MFGPHVSRYHAPGTTATIAEHIEAARLEAADGAAFQITAAAIFVGGPRQRHITLKAAEAADLRRYLTGHSSHHSAMRCVAHSAYAANPWGGHVDAAKFIRGELAVCQAAGITGLVVHLPKESPATVMQYIDRLVNQDAPDVRVYLETPAVKPRDSQYETPEKLAALFELITQAGFAEQFGVCIDTAHLWTCGVDISSYGAAHDWLERLEAEHAVIPPSHVMLHVNDSVRPLGVGPDEHAALGHGRIWASYLEDQTFRDGSGLAAFVDYAGRHDVTAILERKPKEALLGDYRVLRDMGAGS